MPKLILIHGVMAGGKSTLCTALDKKLKDYVFVDRAYIKKCLKPLGSEPARKVSKKATLLILEETMKVGGNIILQEMSPSNLRKKIGPSLRKYKYKVHSFHLYCALPTAMKRDVARSKKARPQEVKKMHELYGIPEKGDIPVNTEKMTVQQSVNIILKTIKKK
jgi:adenylylsulfate kinase-like enzyme